MKKKPAYAPRRRSALTSREHEVIFWLGEWKTNWEIGVLLGCDEETIKTHVRNIFLKLGVHKRAGVLAVYRQRRLARYRPARLKRLARTGVS